LLVVSSQFDCLDREGMEIEGIGCPSEKSADEKEPLKLLALNALNQEVLMAVYLHLSLLIA